MEIRSFLRSLAKDHDLMFFLSDFRSLPFSVRISPAVIKVVVTIFIFFGRCSCWNKEEKKTTGLQKAVLTNVDGKR